MRLLVTEDERGDVWAVYTDFNWIAQRHGITNRGEQYKTASGVVASITGAVAGTSAESPPWNPCPRAKPPCWHGCSPKR